MSIHGWKPQLQSSRGEPGHFLAYVIFMAHVAVILNPCSASFATPAWVSPSNSTNAMSCFPGTRRTSLNPGNLKRWNKTESQIWGEYLDEAGWYKYVSLSVYIHTVSFWDWQPHLLNRCESWNVSFIQQLTVVFRIPSVWTCNGSQARIRPK